MHNDVVELMWSGTATEGHIEYLQCNQGKYFNRKYGNWIVTQVGQLQQTHIYGVFCVMIIEWQIIKASNCFFLNYNFFFGNIVVCSKPCCNSIKQEGLDEG